MKIKCFDNMKKMYVTYSKSKGKFSNDINNLNTV